MPFLFKEKVKCLSKLCLLLQINIEIKIIKGLKLGYNLKGD